MENLMLNRLRKQYIDSFMDGIPQQEAAYHFDAVTKLYPPTPTDAVVERITKRVECSTCKGEGDVDEVTERYESTNAVEFAKWINEKSCMPSITANYWTGVGISAVTTESLYQIFKEEKEKQTI